MKRLITLFCLFLSAIIYSQVTPVIDWYKTNYSDNIYNPGINCFTADSNFNLYFTQNISRTDRTVYLSLGKFSSEGDSLYGVKYGPDENKSYSANCLQIDRDGNIYAAGNSNSGSVTHPLLLKYNNAGELLWQDDFAYSSEQKITAADIAVFLNNNVVLAYQSVDTFTDYVNLKCYSQSGDALWTITMLDDTSRYLTNYLLSDHSDYIYAVIAQVYNLNQQFTSANFIVLKINPDGEIVWRKDLGDYNPDSAVLDNEGNIILIGQDGGRIKKMTPNGEILWTYFNEDASVYRIYYCGTVDSDNNIIVTGRIGKIGGPWDYLTTKISADGDSIWSRNFASEEGLNDKAYTIAVDKEDNIYISGESADVNTLGPCYTLRYSKDGDLIWRYRLHPDNAKSTEVVNIFVDDSSRIYLGCSSLSSGNINSYILLRLKQTGSVDVEDETFNKPCSFALEQNYPNPFNPSTRIRYSISEESFVTLSIYDVLGKKIKTLVNETKQPGIYEVSFNAGSLSSGLYICTLRAGRLTESRKFILLK